MPLKTLKLVLIDLTWNPRCILNESTTMYNNKVHKRNFTINIEFKDIINLLIAFGKYKFNKWYFEAFNNLETLSNYLHTFPSFTIHYIEIFIHDTSNQAHWISEIRYSTQFIWTSDPLLIYNDYDKIIQRHLLSIYPCV